PESRQAAFGHLDCLGGATGSEQRRGDQLVTVRAGAVLREDGDERIDIVLGSGEVLHDLRQPEAPGVPRAAASRAELGLARPGCVGELPVARDPALAENVGIPLDRTEERLPVALDLPPE